MGTSGVDMQWLDAMDIFTGATAAQSQTGTIVAVIDYGVGYNHPDLANQMWDGTACKDENGNFL
jgi:subtilisin family serine protease